MKVQSNAAELTINRVPSFIITIIKMQMTLISNILKKDIWILEKIDNWRIIYGNDRKNCTDAAIM